MKRVLIPVDGSANSLQAVQHVVTQRFAGSDAEVHMLHVRVPLPRYVSRFLSGSDRMAFHRDAAEKVLRASRELLSRHGVPYSVHVALGEPATVIGDVATRLRVDQIVIGTARKNLLTRLVQDSVSSRVVEIARVPVQLVSGAVAPRWENVGIPALVSAVLAALVLAAVD